MENVHILTQRVSARGEFLPFSAEHYRISEPNSPHDLV
ncbi:MAG: GGDEF domain-containing protein, partial [Pseudomonadota bacterium]